MGKLTRNNLLRHGINIKGLDQKTMGETDSILMQENDGPLARLTLDGLKSSVGYESSGTLLRIGDDTDYLLLGGDDALHLAGSRTVWDDLDFAMTVRTTGPNTPSLADLNGTGIYGYVYATGKEAFFQRQIPHKFKQGQTWRPHVHWMPTTTATYTGTFTLDYIYHGAGNGSLLSNKATVTGTFDVSGTAYTSQVTSLATIAGITMEISTVVYARLLVTLTAGTSIVLSGMDWHGEIDSLGSKDDFVK